LQILNQQVDLYNAKRTKIELKKLFLKKEKSWKKVPLLSLAPVGIPLLVFSLIILIKKTIS
jgi:hypothetical protein